MPIAAGFAIRCMCVLMAASAGCARQTPGGSSTKRPASSDELIVRVDLVAHRTGGRWGVPLTEQEEQSRNPLLFVVLANNDREEGLPGRLRDFDDHAMKTPPSGDSDDDVVKVTLEAKRSGAIRHGTLRLSTSHPAAVRFFKSDGRPLNDWNLDLARPSGDLAPLADGPMDVWFEGLRKCADLEIKLSYEPAEKGTPVAREAEDLVRCRLVEWTFRDPHGQESDGAVVVSKDRLLDLARGVPGAAALGKDSLYKVRIDGLSKEDLSDLTMQSGTFDEAISDDVIEVDGGVESRFYYVVYLAHDDTPLTAEERQLIENRMGIRPIHD